MPPEGKRKTKTMKGQVPSIEDSSSTESKFSFNDDSSSETTSTLVKNRSGDEVNPPLVKPNKKHKVYRENDMDKDIDEPVQNTSKEFFTPLTSPTLNASEIESAQQRSAIKSGTGGTTSHDELPRSDDLDNISINKETSKLLNHPTKLPMETFRDTLILLKLII